MKKFAAFTMTAMLVAAMASQVAALPARPAEIYIPKVGSATPVIDGKFDPAEGWGEPLVDINEANYGEYLLVAAAGHSTNGIKGYYRWDDTNLYFCCVVEDKDHINTTAPGANPWNGDSIRFDIKCDLDSEDLNDTSKYRFALCDDGNVSFFQEKAETGLVNVGGDTATSGYKVVHDKAAGVTVYEVAVKWEHNTPAGKVYPGFEFVTAQRVMELSTGEAEPMQAVQLCGYETDPANSGTKWFVAMLDDAVPEVVETEAVAEDVVVEEAVTAPQTFNAGVIAAVAAVVSAAGYAVSKKR